MRAKDIVLLVNLINEGDFTAITAERFNVPIFGYLLVYERDGGYGTTFILDKMQLSFDESRRLLKERYSHREIWIRVSGEIVACKDDAAQLSTKDRYGGGEINLPWNYELHADTVEFISDQELDELTAPPEH